MSRRFREAEGEDVDVPYGPTDDTATRDDDDAAVPVP